AAIKQHYENLVSKYAKELSLFDDIPFSDPDYLVLAYFKEKRIIQGLQGKLFPEQTMSRAEFAYAFAQVKKTGELSQATERSFHDTPTNQFYSRSLKYLKELGLIQGYADGTFHPDEAITWQTACKILGCDNTSTEVLSRRQALKLIYDSFPTARLYPKQDFASKPEVELSEKEIIVNGKSLRGLFVNLLVSQNSFEEETLKQELKEIRDSGFIGISSEISWNAIEGQEDNYEFPAYFDRLMEIAAEEGLWVEILLAPHYTPNWVFEKYGDIRLYDNNIKPVFHDNLNVKHVAEGHYLTFSPSSPAVTDQIEWQQESVRHYSRHNNLLAVFLGNEQSYLKDQLIDYSEWAKQAWKVWLKILNLDENTPLPVDPADNNFFLFQRFRQDTLNDYLNRVYKEVKELAPTDLILAHKTLFYESTAADALHYALKPSALELAGDVVANDIYGFAPNVYAAENTFRVPKIIVETNLLGESWDADSLYYLLMYHYLQGVNLQGIFRWDESSDGRSMFGANSKLLPKSKGAIKAAWLIRNLSKTIPSEPPNFGIIIPTKSLALNAGDFEKHQHKLDQVHLLSEHTPGMLSSLLWADNISIEGYFKPPGKQATHDLSIYQKIYAPIDQLDAAAVNNGKIKNWVSSGGTLILEPENRWIINWLPDNQGDEVIFGKGKVIYKNFEL
ncbi:MAG: beta-galactosidase, partial [Candidatus Gracilibacteria bacterium]|nr:beta-galactosidase [Candidatus Gracilibacteria bacterium]